MSRRYAAQDHLTVKTYRCPARSCGKRFTTSSNLARHRRLHGDELQPLVCPVPACAEIFTNQHKLQRHMRVHMGTSTHRCEFDNCAKTFSSIGNLNRHVRNQHVRVGHQFVKKAKNNTSITTADTGYSRMSAKGSSSPTSVAMKMNVVCDNLQLLSGSEHRVSDEELLEALSCLLDDDDA